MSEAATTVKAPSRQRIAWVIQDISDLLVSRDAWCKGAAATDLLGFDVLPTGSRAAKFCIGGAVWSSLHAHGDRALRGAVLAALKQALPEGVTTISEFNDRADQAQLLAYFQRAVKLAKGSD